MNQLYINATKVWGIDNRRWGLIEECGEVMQAFSHEKRGRCDKNKVIDELIDLQIVLNMVRRYYISDKSWDLKILIAEKELKYRMIVKDDEKF